MAQRQLYGLGWAPLMDPLAVEFQMLKLGGTVKRKDGKIVGNGMFWHWKRAQQLMWPETGDEFTVRKKWHRWNELQAECYLKYRTIAVIGAASTGKTNAAATDALLDYYLYPSCTSIIICSTTRERLEERIWGEIKKYHKAAKSRFPWLPGNLIEGRLRLVTDSRDSLNEGRDFRNGVLGVACKRGENLVSIGEFAGLKNKRVRLVGDELALLPKIFVDSISNLDKNPDFKCVGMGNPKETTDALGILAEPAAEIGGWDSGIDQGPKTKTWPTRRPEGICIQLVGSDSPNLDGALGIPLITQEQIDRDVAFYGKDSVWFTMMNEGRMPRGQGSHRVLTRQMCEKFHALEDPTWRDSNLKRIAFMDAGYGGDRCIFGELQFGKPAELDIGQVMTTGALANNEGPLPMNRQIVALVDTINVPISNDKGSDLPEDQIVKFVVAELAKRNIPLSDFFYEPGQRTKLTVAFSRNTGEIGNPIDCLGKASERQVATEIDVKCVDYYSKFITELWYSVRLIVASGQFRGMKPDVMWEFCVREWGYVGKNKIEVESKEKMKEKTGRSPDLADAVAIGIEGCRQRGFNIAWVGKVPGAKKASEAWKRTLTQQSRKAWTERDLNYSS